MCGYEFLKENVINVFFIRVECFIGTRSVLYVLAVRIYWWSYNFQFGIFIVFVIGILSMKILRPFFFSGFFIYITGIICVLMGYYRCILEVCHWYTWFTLIAYKIYINTPLLSHSDISSIIPRSCSSDSPARYSFAPSAWYCLAATKYRCFKPCTRPECACNSSKSVRSHYINVLQPLLRYLVFLLRYLRP